MSTFSLQPGHFRATTIGTLVITIGVILYGAWVRITGSGAGCGQHWPDCHGHAIPRPESIETVIEFTHRASSGMAFVLVVLLVVMGVIIYARGHRARRWAWIALFFMVTEALIGAGLVLFGLVETDDSVARAAAMTLHLVNTFLLTGSLTLTLHASLEPSRYQWNFQRQNIFHMLLCMGGLTLLIIGMSGAITALGDTLYPIDPATGQRLLDRLALEQHPTAHFLVRMRVLHPVLAVVGGIFVAIVVWGIHIRQQPALQSRWAHLTGGLVITQLAVGFANIALHAPGWMQLVHLGFATVIWISYVYFAANILYQEVGVSVRSTEAT